MEEAFDWIDGFLRGRTGRPLNAAERLTVARVEARANELISEFRDRRQDLAGDARQFFQLLGQIPVVLKWDQGLKADMSALILCAVNEAERFGDGQGPKKRRFAIELIVRVTERYNYYGLPFLPVIDRTIISPMVGVLIDWSVVVLNLHAAWPPVRRVTFPSIFQGSYGVLFKIGFRIAAVVVSLRKWLLFPSKYERNIRHALRHIDPEVRDLLGILPPDRLHAVFEELVNILAKMGQVTAPYVRLVDQILRLGDLVINLTPAEQQEAAFRVLRGLLEEAYADDAFALAFIDSPLGEFLLRAVVEHTTWILVRNGLLPSVPPRRQIR